MGKRHLQGVFQMTSKEIVRRAIHFQRPSRLPALMGELGINDTGWVVCGPSPRFTPTAPGMDEWGCVWSQTEMHNMGQVTGHPLEDITKLATYSPPDYTEDERFTGMDAALRQRAPCETMWAPMEAPATVDGSPSPGGISSIISSGRTSFRTFKRRNPIRTATEYLTCAIFCFLSDSLTPRNRG